MYRWPFPIVSLMLCHSAWHAESLSFSHTFIFMCSFFPFLLMSTRMVGLFTTKAHSCAVFHFLVWSLLLMPYPLIGPFIFRNLGYLYQLVVPGQVPCVGLMLPCRTFMLLPSCYVGWPSASLIKWLPCTWITVLLRLISVIKMVQCLLFLPAGLPDIESDWQAWYDSSSSIHSYPSQCGGRISIPGLVAFWVSPPSGGFSPLGLPEVDLLASSHSTHCQHYFTLDTSLPLWALGLNAFSHPWTFLVSYISFSRSGPSSSDQVSSRRCQLSTQTFDSGGTMLDGGTLASHHSQHVGRCSLAVYHHKRSHHGCFSRPGTQGSVISAFNLLAAQQCVLCQQGFSSSVCQGRGNSNVYIKGLLAVLEWMGQLVCLTGFTKQCHICP